MNSRPLAIVTTRLPPLLCGVGSYSLRIEQAWPHAPQNHTLLVCEGGSDSSAELKSGKIVEHRATAHKLSSELENIGDCDVLLHYAARAYHRYGFPTWLGRALERWKSQASSNQLVIMFHEMPSKIPLTSRHFLPNYLNARNIRRLAKIADAVVTNTADQAATFAALTGRADVLVLPVAANIEPDTGTEIQRQHSEFIVFGLPFGREQSLQRFAHLIPDWIQAGVLTRLHIVGPREDRHSEVEERILDATGVRPLTQVHGSLPARAVSDLLSQSNFALTNASKNTWSKSGVFMACAAHRCAIVGPEQAVEMPLTFVVQPGEVATISQHEIDQRTSALRDWYNANAAWPVIAARLAGLFEKTSA